MLFKNIKEDIQKFNNSHNSDIPNELEKIPIKEYRGNQHDLDTYLNTINYMEYIKNNRKNGRKTKVISHENTFDNISSLQDHLEKTQFNKKWSRLDNYLKKIKLKEFLKNKIKNEIIAEEKYDFYYSILINMLNNKKLNKKTELIYDEENANIVDIPIFKSLIIN
jgi:hypothetical protein